MGKLRTALGQLEHYKYFITILFFVSVLGFVGENSFLSRYYHQREITELKSEIAKYHRQYNADTERLNELSTHTEALEKIARERYYMKTDKEDVFIFSTTEDDE